jgi:hypothetical protein
MNIDKRLVYFVAACTLFVISFLAAYLFPDPDSNGSLLAAFRGFVMFATLIGSICCILFGVIVVQGKD